jgi:hypothetical protein
MGNGLEPVILDILNTKLDLGLIPLQDAENSKKKEKIKVKISDLFFQVIYH